MRIFALNMFFFEFCRGRYGCGLIVFKMDQHGQVKHIITTAFLFRLIRVQGHLYDRAVLTAAPGTSVAAASSSAAAAAEEGDEKEAAKGNFSLAGFSRLMLIDMCILAGDVHSIHCRWSIPLPACNADVQLQAAIICQTCPAPA